MSYREEAIPVGISYEVHEGFGEGVWFPIAVGKNATKTSRQARDLIESVKAQGWSNAPKYRIVKVTREVEDEVT